MVQITEGEDDDDEEPLEDISEVEKKLKELEEQSILKMKEDFLKRQEQQQEHKVRFTKQQQDEHKDEDEPTRLIESSGGFRKIGKTDQLRFIDHQNINRALFLCMS